MRLLVHVEGPTEETFVNNVLSPHLMGQGYSLVAPRLIGDARPRSRRGGGLAWQSVRQGILRHLKRDRHAVSTTMVDYYGMPQSRSRQWPGRVEATNLLFEQKTEAIQNALAQDIRQHMGGGVRPEPVYPLRLHARVRGAIVQRLHGFRWQRWVSRNRQGDARDTRPVRQPGEDRRFAGNRSVKTYPRLDPELQQGGNGRRCHFRHRLGQHPLSVPKLRRWLSTLEAATASG